MIDQSDANGLPDNAENGGADLARRLARYRRRVEAEGRSNSVKLIDRAIDDANRKTHGSL